MSLGVEDTDEALLEAWRDRADREALSALFKRLLPFALAVARPVAGPAAEDAVQDAFLEVIRSARTFRPGGRVRPWLARVVVNAAGVRARGEARVRRREARLAAEAARGPGRPEPAGLGAEEARLLALAVGALPLEEKLPVVLHYQQGLTHEEVAEVLEVSERTVIRRLERALGELRRSLGALGGAAVGAAAVAESLGSMPGEMVSAALAAKVGAMAGSAKAGGASAGATAAAAAKGGMAMKIVLGVALAGALAGGAAVFLGPSAGPSSPTPAGKPTVEHFAFAVGHGSLDGPRRESMGYVLSASCDAQGNIFFFGGASLRVARVDGEVETVAGDEWSRAALKLDEGPAAFVGNLFTAGGIGRPVTQVHVQGNPLEGGDKGSIIVSAGGGDGHEKCVYKIWRNKEKQDRWWFKVLIGRGKGIPAAVGQSVAAGEAKFGAFPAFSKGGDGKLYVLDNGNVYRFDGDKETLTCIMVASAYAGVERFGGAAKNPNAPITPDNFLVGEDGTVYLDFYNSTYPLGGIVRVSADGKKAEWVIKSGGRAGTDGPGLETGWFCGPQFRAYVPGGNVFLGAIDEAQIRRWKDGRVASLCRDGQFRELSNARGAGGGSAEDPAPYDKFADGGLPGWGRGWVIGGKDFWYQVYHMGGGSRFIWRIGPVDFNRPTTGPLLGGK